LLIYYLVGLMLWWGMSGKKWRRNEMASSRLQSVVG
jgi:hypothetical protein